MTIKSTYAGKCKVDPSHVWQVGDQLNYQADPKAICNNKTCFDLQVKEGGIDNVLAKIKLVMLKTETAPAAASTSEKLDDKPKPSTVRDNTQRVNDARCMLETIWPIAVKKAEEAYPIPKDAAPLVIDKIEYNRRILAQVFLKVMTQEYTR